MREAKIRAGKNHPAIVPFVGFIDDKERPAIVTKFMSGGSLNVLPLERDGDVLPLGWNPGRIAKALYAIAWGQFIDI